MSSSAVLVQTNGSQRSFQPSMKVSIALMRSLTDVKVPRLIAWRVMIPKKISTMFSQDPGARLLVVGTRGFFASHALTAGCLWVA